MFIQDRKTLPSATASCDLGASGKAEPESLPTLDDRFPWPSPAGVHQSEAVKNGTESERCNAA